ncbi:putative ABC transporter ATP-binding protein uup-1 [Actinobacillus pleuropneumoniae]|uniref:ABC transporter ATP-binding protein n=1 Tax=Actinobacillus pleuropneumoniae TaxID=715 RepID=UPI0005850075|nr:ABC transporter ATP-binding protein [Actinobacillus pleuropneumoniae]KIE92714.1 putative ABC transporter ATP-binding protein uup-1 [Actinobacillus pleuropneumoniae]KIE93262.1 putative ABC transporter ATP-binding protein uup-1 [Actinobacillus pleuropneumoniae]KIE93507.1 putative ABC transporter ATP-binding protein uup-1 [Actinobacillus pleuropneumoniae]KIE98279.1 putative ABC transporter ATP-binding protein uup-1 [Actinobacillus pleuropneumoniae]KIE99611.1 putative ABC transporter ATP-bindin
MALLNLSNAYLGFGDHPLLDHTELHIEPGERVCLVGRNGAGKSTLMKVLAGEVQLDDGKLIFEKDIVVTRLEQDPPRHIQDTVFDYVAEGIAHLSDLLKQYHHISQQMQTDYSDELLSKLSHVQAQLEHNNGWQFENRIQDTLKLLELDPDKRLCELSGGWVRRAALARALVADPDILLLDEPTNHLDVEAITWLEDLLLNFKGSIIFISHDRSFIRKMATRIVDLDRGKLVSYPSNYDLYLETKAEDLRVEALQNELFDKKLAQEEVWIRQGIKARRTRNEGRVRALKALREERRNRREVQGTAKIQIDQTARSGKIVFEVENASYEIEGKTLLKNFTTTIQRGDKIALVGTNGCGKTTFIKLLLGELQPTSGSIRCGTKLEVAYFDQYRAELDLEKTVMDNVADGKQDVEVNGVKRHVLGYLQDFLFPPKRAMTPVKALSGGERNRLLLAKLLLKPNNLLILDEPTNDLDVETLELLEELLADYQGTLLIVSHDRQFIDNTVTECYFFEGNGVLNKYVGGYFDAKQQQENYYATIVQNQPNKRSNSAENLQKTEEKQPLVAKSEPVKKVKLSYKDQRELDELPEKMEALEAEMESLQAEVNSADFFSKDSSYTQAQLQKLADAEMALEAAFERWEALENIKNGNL